MHTNNFWKIRRTILKITNSSLYLLWEEHTMGLKETLAKKILEMKLSGATKNMRAAIQKLQQQYDELVNENKDKK